jgi:hypothetical protein
MGTSAQNERMRSSSLSKGLLSFSLAFAGLGLGCGRKGDPLPRPRVAPRAPEARWLELRRLEVVLPTQDQRGQDLVGIEQVRILHVPLGLVRPSAEEVFAKGEVVFEKRRPDLPKPGGTFVMDLATLRRPAGWIVVVAVRVGEVPGRPSEVLPWLSPEL